MTKKTLNLKNNNNLNSKEKNNNGYNSLLHKIMPLGT